MDSLHLIAWWRLPFLFRQRPAEHLSHQSLGQFAAKLDILGHLVGGQVLSAEINNLCLGGSLSRFEDDKCLDPLPFVRCRNSNSGGLEDLALFERVVRTLEFPLARQGAP